MPACDAVHDRIAQWIAGELDPEPRRELEAHLGACTGCAAEAGRLREALALLEHDEGPDPGPLYWGSFGSRLRARIAASARRRSLLRLAAVAAALAVAVAGLAIFQVRLPSVPRELSGGEQAAVTVTPRALPVAEADARLAELLNEAPARDQDLSDLNALLDEIAPLDTPDAADALGRVPPDEGPLLVEELLDGHG
ncbi:MAG TPA: zf-HC2 domain-containing protein [Candidatus Polarisedimenticolia bacterium]|jgi:anti-sigma factor RsiW|nr:zf-HC2 domain-containing protein [Candidatus Polarisedimenticolia bacterium]